MPRHLHLDPFSGIAGDMFLGALLDLGVPLAVVRDALGGLELAEPYELLTQRVQRCGVGGVDFRVKLGASKHSHNHEHKHEHHHHDHSHHHHHVGYSAIMAMVQQLDLDDRHRRLAEAVVTKLADAEARVHGVDREKIHFHEVGAVDSIVDMLGSVVALQHLNVGTISCGPVPLSRGYVKCAHGLMPVPAPATAYLLDGVPTVGVDRTGELVTPTGAALIAGLCDTFGPPQAMTLRGVGYGAGDRDDPDVPNLLRVLIGDTAAPGDLGPLTPGSLKTEAETSDRPAPAPA